MKADALTMSLLFDYYGELLTEKQKTCFDLYYNQDFTLSEIAEQERITRQGVHDSLVRAEALLFDFEEKIGCIRRSQENQKAVQTIESAARALKSVAGAESAAERILLAVQSIKE